MAGEYAARTDVPVSRSRDEIERTLNRFGATGFAYASQGANVMIAFEVKNLRVVMTMALPIRSQFERDKRGLVRSDSAIERDWEQACRQRWRSLANGIKAKLALIDDGISTVEREFLADVMTADGQTIGQKVLPQLADIVRTAELPSLVPGLPPAGRVIALSDRTGS